jgi:hypothetical protein
MYYLSEVDPKNISSQWSLHHLSGIHGIIFLVK